MSSTHAKAAIAMLAIAAWKLPRTVRGCHAHGVGAGLPGGNDSGSPLGSAAAPLVPSEALPLLAP